MAPPLRLGWKVRAFAPSSLTVLIPSSPFGFLDDESQWDTIVAMAVLTVKRKLQLFEPYVEILQDVRTSQSLSQAKLAKGVGLSSKYVTLVEGGKRVPSLESLLALMAEAGVMRSTGERLVREVMDQFEWSG